MLSKEGDTYTHSPLSDELDAYEGSYGEDCQTSKEGVVVENSLLLSPCKLVHTHRSCYPGGEGENKNGTLL